MDTDFAFDRRRYAVDPAGWPERHQGHHAVFIRFLCVPLCLCGKLFRLAL